jgi:DGQHR domain-containing protein
MSKKTNRPAATPPTTAATVSRSPGYSTLKLEQNGHSFFLTTIPIDDLFDYCVVERRNENPTEGFQRRLSASRAEEIAEYLNTEGKSISVNIVLSAQPEAELVHVRENKSISFKRVAGAFVILDGQHRLWGYHKCAARHRVPVTIYEGLSRHDEVGLFVDINTKHQGVPKALILDVKGLAGSESADEKLLRELFDRLNTDEESPLRNKLSAAQSASGKLSRTAFNTAVSRALKRDSLRRLSSKDKQYELILKFLQAFHEEIADKSLLIKRHFISAIFDLFDEIVKKAKKELGGVTPDSLQIVISPICNLTEDRLPKTQKRESLVDVMRNMLNSDTSIEDDDISNS